jgi:proteasome lid subunit RPN8/RPN11
MNEENRALALEHAKSELPREACGLVVIVDGSETYWPCRNISPSYARDEFAMDPRDYADAEAAGEITELFHSHINIPPTPSQADLVSCEATGLKWIIASLPTETWHEFEPSGYEAPLVGRTHCWGSLDCWTVVHDWYRRERGIVLMNVPRAKDFWKRGEDPLGQNWRAAGFRQLTDDERLDVGDVLLMQTGDSMVPNHVALYIGDDQILHHAENRLSSRDVYGGWYKKHTVKVVRYEGDQAER